MRLWTATVVLVGASIGCGGSSPDGPTVRHLTRDDVVGLGPGNATGAGFSGLYRFTQNQIEACHCRVGTCSSLSANVGRIAQVTQADGWLQMLDQATSTASEGGVNADGSFQLAFLNEDPANMQFSLVAGTVAISGDTPVSMQMVQEATGMTAELDCDVRTRAVATYVGPLTAAFDEDSP